MSKEATHPTLAEIEARNKDINFPSFRVRDLRQARVDIAFLLDLVRELQEHVHPHEHPDAVAFSLMKERDDWREKAQEQMALVRSRDARLAEIAEIARVCGLHNIHALATKEGA